MSNSPTTPEPIEAADRLRTVENERFTQRPADQGDGLEGLREFSRAWHENRSTGYILRKSWADPVSRTLTIVILTIIAAVWTYLLAS